MEYKAKWKNWPSCCDSWTSEVENAKDMQINFWENEFKTQLLLKHDPRPPNPNPLRPRYFTKQKLKKISKNNIKRQ